LQYTNKIIYSSNYISNLFIRTQPFLTEMNFPNDSVVIFRERYVNRILWKKVVAISTSHYPPSHTQPSLLVSIAALSQLRRVSYTAKNG